MAQMVALLPMTLYVAIPTPPVLLLMVVVVDQILPVMQVPISISALLNGDVMVSTDERTLLVTFLDRHHVVVME